MANEEIKQALKESGLKFTPGEPDETEPIDPFPCNPGCLIPCQTPCWSGAGCAAAICAETCLGIACYGICSVHACLIHWVQ